MSTHSNGNLKGSLSIGKGERGKSLEFLWEGTKLGIKVEGETEFQFTDLGVQGSNGKEVQLQVANGYIQWKYENEEIWNNLIALSELKGAKGDTGLQGEQGLPGKNGVTPNIQIGTVTTLESGKQATVTNSGTLENPIFNFGIPKGQDGTGGGNYEGKRLINTIELTEAVNTIEINQDSEGTPLSELNLKSISVIIFASHEASISGQNYCVTNVNNQSIFYGQNNCTISNNVVAYKFNFDLNNDGTANVMFQMYAGATAATIGFGIPYNNLTKELVIYGDKINSISLSHSVPEGNLKIGSKIIVYGE